MSTAQQENPLLASRESVSFGEYVAGYFRRIRAGDFGTLPIIIGLVLIAAFFQAQNSNFLTPRNLVNLIVQMAGITTIAYGVVFVLLIGEIDLSVSYISAVVGVALVVVMTRGIPLPGEAVLTLPWFLALPFVLLVAALIGFIQGSIITYLGVPAFIVTLAGFLVWSGMVQVILGRGGLLRITDPVITGVANSFIPGIWGWILGIVVVGIYVLFEVQGYRYRQAENLGNKPILAVVLQIIAVAVITVVVVGIANQDRGVPGVGILLLVLLIGMSFASTRTSFGRYLYAVGGNAEAARRAGVNVQRIRLSAFVISAVMAGVGGIVLVSRLRSVSSNAGGGDLLLNAIAAAVIGGTSLFGGRGHVSSAILGALVIASLDNGMGLLGWSAGIKSIVTGIVLVIAVLLDSLSRQRQKRAGIA